MVDKAIILVNAAQYIEPTCDASLRSAEKAGFDVWRNFGNESQDVIRSSMAMEALSAGFTELIWIDPDISFHVLDLVKVRAFKKPVFTALYPLKGTNDLCGNITAHNKQTGEILLNQAGSGFLYTRASVYQDIVDKLKLLKCSHVGKSFYPWFMPFVERGMYFSEMMAFCYRLGKSGHKIEAKADICVDHIGTKPWKFSIGLDKLPYFIKLASDKECNIAAKQEDVDKAMAKELGRKYTKVWSGIHEISKEALAQGTAASYNPSIVRHKGQLWLFYRHDAKTALHCTTWQERRPIGIRAVQLTNEYQVVPGTDHGILVPPTWEEVVLEDPKAMSDGEHVWLSAVEPNFIEGLQSAWVVGVNISKQLLENGKFVTVDSGMPAFGDNPGMEKNWAPFTYDGKVFVNYSMDPHVVFNRANPAESYETPGANWGMGEIVHGGTPPVKVGNEYFSFMHGKSRHSQLLQRPIYYMVGCVGFEAQPPFRITKFTQDPILWSDLSMDPHRHMSCVFPGGAIYDMNKNEWAMSYGHNDIACRILTVPHDKLLSSMSPV